MSLAALAHGASQAAPAFNGLFYATAATIIPVLFLAISFQSTTWQDMGKAFSPADRAIESAALQDSPLSIRLIVLSFTMGILTAAILLSGAIGEIYAIVALYQRRAASHSPFFVLTATIFLTAATAGIPVLTFFRAVRQERRGNSAAKQSATDPPGEQHHDTEGGT
jgi:RsiW-degrading membrane proteinase PrsW (M82 family)